MTAAVQDVIMLFGDSLTQRGWEPTAFAQQLSRELFPNRLILTRANIIFFFWCSEVYVRKLDVVNRGLSGYNTEWAIPVFEQVSASPKHA